MAHYNTSEGSVARFTRTNAPEEDLSNERDVILNQVIGASREDVFRAWTNPGIMTRWWGPEGASSTVCELNAFPGGSLRVVVSGPGNQCYLVSGVFREVVEPSRISFTNFAVDDKGHNILDSQSVVSLVEHELGTEVVLQSSAIGLSDKAEAMLKSMEDSWRQSLWKLDALLAKKPAHV